MVNDLYLISIELEILSDEIRALSKQNSPEKLAVAIQELKEILRQLELS